MYIHYIYPELECKVRRVNEKDVYHNLFWSMVLCCYERVQTGLSYTQYNKSQLNLDRKERRMHTLREKGER